MAATTAWWKYPASSVGRRRFFFPHEQIEAYLSFQTGDEGADGWLGNAQPRGCIGDCARYH